MCGAHAAFFLVFLFFAPLFGAVMHIQGPFPARDGETCIVCNTRVSRRDLAFTIDGQRVAVRRGMEKELLSNPRKYAGRLQPRGLMTSTESPGTGSNVLLYAGGFVLIGLVFGGLCAHMAMVRGLPAWQWFVFGFLFSFVACLLLGTRRSASNFSAARGLEKIHSTREPAPCPHCAGTNHPAAAKCSHCGASLQPSAPSEAAAV
jgi:hypothetical protein